MNNPSKKKMNASLNLIILLFILNIHGCFAQLKCNDDPFYTFGRIRWKNKQGKVVFTKRTCAWLTRKNPSARKAKWCNHIHNFGVNVGDKCPVTCGKCPPIGLPDRSKCQDNPKGWKDLDGRDCEFYAQGENCQTFFGRDRSGKTAKDVCCACGGGCADIEVFPEDSNVQIPWHDSLGETYDCEWYGRRKRTCDIFGTSYRNHGYVAQKACCVCGGGNKF